MSNAEAISSSSAQLLEDEETGEFAPLFESEVDDLPTPHPEDVAHDGMVGNVQWDEDATMTLNPSMRQVSGWDRGISTPPRRYEFPGPRRADERTPLLRKAISLTINTSTLTSIAPTKGRDHQESLSSAPALAPKILHDPGLPEGRSTFGQTVSQPLLLLYLTFNHPNSSSTRLPSYSELGCCRSPLLLHMLDGSAGRCSSSLMVSLRAIRGCSSGFI